MSDFEIPRNSLTPPGVNGAVNLAKGREVTEIGGNDGSPEPRSAHGRQSRSEHLKALLEQDLLPGLRLTEDHILSVLLVRRARSDVLGKNLFSDPAWDILLELYAAKLGRRQMSAEDLARAIETPKSVTGRWIAALEEQGLTRRDRTRSDPTCTWVSLTCDGAKRMERLADHWGSAFVTI